jgi:transcription-repair coupling factor (superfamily II helicase)
MIKYYRTTEDFRELAKEMGTRFKHCTDFVQYLVEKHQLKQLGILAAVRKESFWVGDGGIVRNHSFKASREIMDGITNLGLLEDMKKGNLVKILGYLEKGKIVNAVALNQKHLIDPAP